MNTVAEDVRNPLFARLYHYVLQRGEGARVRRCRETLVAGLSGRVLEIGAGDGPNFALYPPEVGEVIAVEPEPFLRKQAHRAAERAPVPVTVVGGTAGRLPLADASVDAVVCALVLCSVPDVPAALGEIRRVLRPGGELRVFEHVVAHHPLGRAAQQLAEVTFWRRSFGNCHPTRDTLGALRSAGFDVSGVRRFVLKPGGIEPPLPHILGAACLDVQRAGSR